MTDVRFGSREHLAFLHEHRRGAPLDTTRAQDDVITALALEHTTVRVSTILSADPDAVRVRCYDRPCPNEDDAPIVPPARSLVVYGDGTVRDDA